MKLIRGCALVLVFLSPAASNAENKWTFLEETKKGPKYVRSDIEFNGDWAFFYTRIDLKAPDHRNIKGKEIVYLSVVLREAANCVERSRSINGSIRFYSGQGATGTEWAGPDLVGENYVYSKSDWEGKGFDRLLCKKAWEFWR